MAEEFLVNLVVVSQRGRMIESKDRQINFNNDRINFVMKESNYKLSFHCSEFVYKPIERRNGAPTLNIPFARNNTKNNVMMKLHFRPEYEQYIDFVVQKFNEFIESNKMNMQDSRINTRQRVMMDQSKNNKFRTLAERMSLYADPPQNNSGPSQPKYSRIEGGASSSQSVSQSSSQTNNVINQVEVKIEPADDHVVNSRQSFGKGIISLSDHQKLLESIQNMIITMQLPIRRDIRIRIQENLEKMKNLRFRTENITENEIRVAASSCILQVIKNARFGLNEDSIGLKEFLMLPRFMIISLNLAFLDEIQELLAKTMDGKNIDKRVPLSRIQSALETIVDIVAP